MVYKWKAKITIPFKREFQYNKIIEKVHAPNKEDKYLIKNSHKTKKEFNNVEEFFDSIIFELDVWNNKIKGKSILFPDIIKALKFIKNKTGEKQISEFQNEKKKRKEDIQKHRKYRKEYAEKIVKDLVRN